MIMSKKKLDSGLSCKAITELQECLELLLSIELFNTARVEFDRDNCQQ
jgi:hypothetical protein